MFHVGQQVVCVATAFVTVVPEGLFPGVEAGRVYTIRGFDPFIDGILLEEVRSPVQRRTGLEYCFSTWRFRPAVRTDITALRSLLKPAPEDVRALEHA